MDSGGSVTKCHSCFFSPLLFRTLLDCPHSVDEAPAGWWKNPLIDRLVMLPVFRGGQNPAAEIAQKKAGTLADSYGGQVNRQTPFLCAS